MGRQKFTKTNQEGYQKKIQSLIRSVLPTSTPAQLFQQLQRTLGNHAFGCFLQAKLNVSQPGDMYEQEADRVADEVMRMPEPMQDEILDRSTSAVQRKCTACASGGELCPECAEEEAMMQRKPLSAQITSLIQRQPEEPEEKEEDTVQAKEGAVETPVASPSVESYINSMRGGGQPLPESTLAFLELRFAQRFSQVKIHTDAKAAESARSVNALAYTVGHDIVFGEGQYAPEKAEGRRLIAHELTHVLQQTGAAGRPQAAPRVMRQAESEPAQRTREEESPGFWGTIGGGLMGEFNEDPSFAMIGVDLGVSLIPILDQASDIRDVIAHLYYIIFRRQYDRFMRWLGLAFTLVGLIPEAGSAIKGASKFIIKGVREVIGHLADILRPLRRLFPEIMDLRRLGAFVNRNWDRFVAMGMSGWNRTLDRISTIVRAIPSFLSRKVEQVRGGLTRIREIAPGKLRDAFAWVKRQWDDVLEQVSERLGLRRSHAEEIDKAVERSFIEHHPGGAPAGPYATTQRLARGNLGERLAAEALGADGHQILMYKPSILGTNQPGIDIVTIRNGVVHLVDNKALTRSGNVASVSALTTNLTANLTAVRVDLTAMLTDAGRSAGERQIVQQALTALNAGNFVRVVTNANLTRDTQILAGVTPQLQALGIRFMNVFPP